MLKSGSMTQRGAAVGSVGMTTFCRSRSTLRDAFSKRARKRSQSGVASSSSTPMIPERVRGLASPAMQQLVDRTQLLGKSGRVDLRHVAHRLPISSLAAECGLHASRLPDAAGRNTGVVPPLPHLTGDTLFQPLPP